MTQSRWLGIRGLIIGLISGGIVALGLMWLAGDLDRWQTRSGFISLTILLFGFSGAVGGIFMGRRSS